MLGSSSVSPPDPELPVTALANESNEDIRRIFATETRFLWISQLIAQEMAEQVHAQRDRYAALPELTISTVNEYFEYHGRATWTRMLSANGDAPKRALALARALGVRAGGEYGRPFTELMLSTKIERHPFVDFGDVVAPLGGRETTVQTEQALFELARSRCSDGKDRADLYEAAVSRSLAAVGPSDLRELVGPLSIPAPKLANPREVDFAFHAASKLLLIGEAKAYFIAPRSDTVINAMSDQVGKAVSQLGKRLDGLAAGYKLQAKGQSVSPADYADVVGLAVPLHSYAGAIFDWRTLAFAGADRQDVAVIPLHSLILVMSLMSCGPDLARYLKYRANLLAQPIAAQDEADIVLHYLRSKSTLCAPQGAAQVRQFRMLEPYTVSTVDVLNAPRPGSVARWRREFRRMVIPSDTQPSAHEARPSS